MSQTTRINIEDPELLSKLLGINTTSREQRDAFAGLNFGYVGTPEEYKEQKARNAARTAGTISGVVSTFAGAGLFIYSLFQLATGAAWLTTLFWALGTTMFGGLILGAILGALAYTLVKLFG